MTINYSCGLLGVRVLRGQEEVKNPEDELVIQTGVLVEPPCLWSCTVLLFNDPFHGFHHMGGEDH